MMVIARNGDMYEAGADLLDATSSHRPDTSWLFVDAMGHSHCWYTDGKPATIYRPTTKYDLPTLTWKIDGTAYYEDGEPYQFGHYECSQCGEKVEPKFTADTVQQFIPGLRWYRINGRHVSREEFESSARKAGLI